MKKGSNQRPKLEPSDESELTEAEIYPEIHIESLDPDEPQQINVVLNADDLQDPTVIARNTPLFIRKLWRMVNDEEHKDIISWNKEGNGFCIHDQVLFITKMLPKYFKHNQLSSFVRQLNLYDFHKIQSVEKRDDYQFGHHFFLKGCPQLLLLIKRKAQPSRQKPTASSSILTPEQPDKIQELLMTVENIKSKSKDVSSEMTKLKQENAALWKEMNSLRLKYKEQTTTVNKLIRFLVSLVGAPDSGKRVSTSNSHKFLKTGPKIMELDYRYRNNPHEFWSDFDNENCDGQDYTVVEPAENKNENAASSLQNSIPIEELLCKAGTSNQSDSSVPETSNMASEPCTSQASSASALQMTRKNENLGYVINNGQFELNSLRDFFKNITPDRMANFYKLINDHYKNQEEDLSLDNDNEIMQLDLLSPVNSATCETEVTQEQVNNTENIVKNQATPSSNTKSNQELTNNEFTEDLSSNNQLDDIGIMDEDLLNAEDLLNVSVDQYFNMD